MTHVLGVVTLASQFIGTGLIAGWLRKTRRESRTWMRPLPAPKLISAVVSLSSGADFVGAV